MIYLASQSFRRREILKKMGVPFRVIRSTYRERRIPGLTPQRLVIRHAVGKVRAAKPPQNARWILGADTVVWCRRKILGKPKNEAAACRVLGLLSGRAHFVYTGLALLDRKTGEMKTAYAKTKVIFKRLSNLQIQNYFKHVNPLDKAGAYAIQSPRGGIVAEVQGSFSNAVGLPMERIKKVLRRQF